MGKLGDGLLGESSDTGDVAARTRGRPTPRFRTTAPVKAIQRLTLANLSPRRHWAATVISAGGKPP
jgi:hypothetical protein